jgi:hypothetical protein
MSAPSTVTLVMGLLALVCVIPSPVVRAAPPSAALVASLQDELGLSEIQVRGGLGALLVFARDRLPETQFNELANRIPNASQIVEQAKAHGIVTRSLDDRDDYEATLANLGIPRATALKFAPAVLEWLGAKGYAQERDILAGVLD